MELTEQLIEELFQAMRERRDADVPAELSHFYNLFRNAPVEVLNETEDVIKPWIRIPLFRPTVAKILNRRRYRFGKRTAPDIKRFSYAMQTEAYAVARNLPYFGDMNLGSLQLLRALSARGIDREQIADTIRSFEAICEGEPLIGMELYPDSSRRPEALAGALILDILYGGHEILERLESGDVRRRRLFSSYDGTKWNYRPMPTCHPLFAMLISELGPYIPHTVPTPYMLCIGTNMKSDAALLLSAWILSHPEISMLAAAVDRYEGDVEFPGIYLGLRIKKLRQDWIFDAPRTQTNLYAGAMHRELPDARDFIRMAGVLAKAHENEPQYFEGFRTAFYDTLREAGVNEGVVPYVAARHLDVIRHGTSFPELAETARGLPTDVSDYIWSGVQRSVAGIERAMYRPEDLTVISRAYSGQLI